MDDVRNTEACRHIFDFGEHYSVSYGVGPEKISKQILSLNFLTKENIKPENCLFIGDTCGDMKIGMSFRGKCLGVTTGNTPASHLVPYCHGIVSSLSELKIEVSK
jgi:phosphoglycolate phosphatase-like HAD superfamily hydrolase